MTDNDCKAKQRERNKKWKEANKDRVRQYKRGRFSELMIVALYQIIHQNQKKSKYEIYLGCSCDRLREYLRSYLPYGLTLESFQACGLSIDHIVPFKAFKHVNDPAHPDCEEERKLVCNYLNLQILPKTANQEKATAYDPADIDKLKEKIARSK